MRIPNFSRNSLLLALFAFVMVGAALVRIGLPDLAGDAPERMEDIPEQRPTPNTVIAPAWTALAAGDRLSFEGDVEVFATPAAPGAARRIVPAGTLVQFEGAWEEDARWVAVRFDDAQAGPVVGWLNASGTTPILAR